VPTRLRAWLDGSPTSRALAAWCTALGLVAFAAGLTGLRDEDTFHLLAVGRDLVRRGGAPLTEPFLFPLANVPSGLPPSWLSSWIIYGFHALLGDPGPVLLAALLLGAVVVVMAIDGREEDFRWRDTLLALAPIALTLAVLRPRAVARPELFANVLLALTLLLVRKHAATGTRAIWIVPVLGVAWTNLHQSALAGVAVLAIHAVTLAASRLPVRSAGGAEPPPWRRVATAGFATGALLLAVGARLGPSSPVRAALDFVRSQRTPLLGGAAVAETAASGVLAMMRNTIVELQPLAAADWLGPFGALTALTLAALLVARRPGWLRELLTASAFVLLAVPTRRFSAQAAVVLAPIAARALVQAARRLGAATGRPARVYGLVAATAVASVALTLPFEPRVPTGLALVRANFPVRAAAYLREVGFRGRLFNTFHFGGYLEWTLDQQVFQDGRGYLRPEDVAAALSGPVHRGAFEALDDRYRFDALVVAYPTVEAETQRRLATAGARSDWFVPSDRWGLAAFDDGGLLYLRRDGRYGHLLERDEFRALLPVEDFPIQALGAAEIAGPFIGELERAVRDAPACAGCRRWLGMALLATDREPEARRVAGVAFEEVRAELGLERERATREASAARAAQLHAEGRALVQAGRAADALPLLRAAFAAAPLDETRLDLAFALLTAGRPPDALAEVDALLAGSPAFADGHFIRGLILEALGRRDDAVAAYRELLRLEPDGQEAPAARARLDTLAAGR
jgi:hypothetical protein